MKPAFLLLATFALFCQSGNGHVPFEHALAFDLHSLQSEGIFSATVDGRAFVPDEYYAERGGGVVSVTAETSEEHTLLLQMPDDIAVGNYPLSYETAAQIMTYYGNGTDGGEAMRGSLKIERHDTDTGLIKGSFHFDGETSEGKPFSVKEGQFSLRYMIY